MAVRTQTSCKGQYAESGYCLVARLRKNKNTAAHKQRNSKKLFLHEPQLFYHMSLKVSTRKCYFVADSQAGAYPATPISVKAFLWFQTKDKLWHISFQWNRQSPSSFWRFQVFPHRWAVLFESNNTKRKKPVKRSFGWYCSFYGVRGNHGQKLRADTSRATECQRERSYKPADRSPLITELDGRIAELMQSGIA